MMRQLIIMGFFAIVCLQMCFGQSDHVKAIELVREAIERIPVNYASRGERQDVFLREICKRGETAHRLIEINGQIKHQGYAETGKMDYVFGCKNIRKSLNVLNLEMDTNGFDFLLGANVVKYRTFFLDLANIDNYLWSIAGEKNVEGRNLIEVSFMARSDVEKPIRSGRLLIDSDSKAFVEIEAELESHIQYFNHSRNLELKNEKFKLLYAWDEECWRLKYGTRSFSSYDQTRAASIDYSVEMYVLHSEFAPPETVVLNPIDVRRDLFKINLRYNPRAWEEYEQMSEIEDIAAVYKDLERVGDMEMKKQFSNRRK